MTQLDASRCTAAPVLQSAIPLAYGDGKPKPLEMNANSPCLLDGSGHAASYALFALPTDRAAYELVVDSQLSSNAYYVFRLLVLDSRGKPLREVPKDHQTLRGNKWRSNVFHTADASMERYLLVMADTEAMGQTEERLVAGVKNTMLNSGTGLYFNYASGTEARQQFTKAFNGALEVTLVAR